MEEKGAKLIKSIFMRLTLFLTIFLVTGLPSKFPAHRHLAYAIALRKSGNGGGGFPTIVDTSISFSRKSSPGNWYLLKVAKTGLLVICGCIYI